MGWGALEPENLGQSVDFITLLHLLHLQAFSNGLDGLKDFYLKMRTAAKSDFALVKQFHTPCVLNISLV